MIKSNSKPVFIHLEVVDSTNNYVANLVRTEPSLETTIVSSDFQTDGRGQRTTKWQSLKAQNALFSMYLKWIELPVADQFSISMQVAISIIKVISRELGEKVTIKWPNDIYLRNAKLGGILIESEIRGSLVNSSILGIGINVNQTVFDSPNATSLKLESGRTHDRGEIIEMISNQIIQDFKQIQKFEKIKEEYIEHLWGLDEVRTFLIVATQEHAEMKILDVSREGKLILKDETNRLQTFDIKELTWLH